jgi:hypothetical protein
MAKANDTLEKQPNETRLFDMYFDNKMRTGETIVSVDSTVSSPAGIVFNSTSFSGQIVQLLISAGDPPDRGDLNYNQYKITVTVTTSAGQVLENEGYLNVQDE